MHSRAQLQELRKNPKLDFEFDCPTLCELNTQQNSAKWCYRDAFDNALDENNLNDLWFVVKHYLHEEDPFVELRKRAAASRVSLTRDGNKIYRPPLQQLNHSAVLLGRPAPSSKSTTAAASAKVWRTGIAKTAVQRVHFVTPALNAGSRIANNNNNNKSKNNLSTNQTQNNNSSLVGVSQKARL
jgi:hypothetical protein